MRRLLTGVALAGALAGCATSRMAEALAGEDAVRFGIEACEHRFLEGLTMEEAIAAAARGRSFSRADTRIETWSYGPRPWRLAGLNVWVGPAGDADEADECRVLALDVGGSVLRDAIIREHLARADRIWTVWSTGGGGRRAVCTTDRVPDGKSLLVVAGHSQFEHPPDLVSAPLPSSFEVSIVNQAVCDRNS